MNRYRCESISTEQSLCCRCIHEHDKSCDRQHGGVFGLCCGTDERECHEILSELMQPEAAALMV